MDQNGQPMYQEQVYSHQYPPQQTAPVVTFKEWMITTLILIIPIVNIVMMFVWAFSSSTNPSKANYFKAQLLFAAIFLVLYILVFVLFLGSFLAGLNSI